MLDFRRRGGTLWIVLVLAVLVALVLLAVAVSWGHAPPGARTQATADEPDVPGTRAA